MKRRIFTALFILSIVFITSNAARQSDEIKRMGIFISNFTELGMYDIDIEAINNSELIRFGIGHNVINNPKSTVKRCTLKNCEYGPSLMSGSAVKASVKKYFDLDMSNRSINIDGIKAEFDGSSYHFDAQEWKSGAVYYDQEWRPSTVYYAEVQKVSRAEGVVHMEGELYNIKKKSDRPAYFAADAKPYKYDGKNTWSILSLSVEWK